MEQDGAICSFDARAGKLTSRIKVAQGDEAVPSLALHPHDSNRLYCCTGSDILCLDRRQVMRHSAKTGYVLSNRYKMGTGAYECLGVKRETESSIFSG